ncbi:hypothetical protein, partial [Salmonella sp. gx-f5]|uniref:hypothetical protein n=1 Tax=Salmonella sp. gx-f5 TaxID=2582605 RepID=UPI001F42845F
SFPAFSHLLLLYYYYSVKLNCKHIVSFKKNIIKILNKLKYWHWWLYDFNYRDSTYSRGEEEAVYPRFFFAFELY